MSLKISNIAKVGLKTSLDEKIARAFQKKISEVLPQVLSFAERDVKRFVKESMENHEIIQSLKGDLDISDGVSLKGEFGLTTQIARDATNKIVSFVAENVLVEERKDSTLRRRSGLVNFRTLTFFIIVKGVSGQQVLANLNPNSEPFAYVSTSKDAKDKRRRRKTLIRWFYWLMTPKRNFLNIDLHNINQYGITTEGKEKSRSGEALMTTSKRKAFRFPYSLPRMIIPRGNAEDFIEAFFNNREFRKKITEVVKKAIKNGFRKFRK